MKKVLFITYYFPPAGGTSVQRVLKFARYLPEFGWKPVILTARNEDYALTDASLLSQVPMDLEIIRRAAPDLYRWYGRLSGAAQTDAPDLSAIAVSEKAKRSVCQRFGLWIRNLMFIPDARLGWLPSAVYAASALLKSGQFNAVFSSSPPFTTALIGGLASAINNVPWISDYRDPWTQAYFYFKRPLWSGRIESALENWLLRKADAVVSVNEKILDGLSVKYPSWQRSRGTGIPNGYDPADFEGLTPVQEKHFTLTYTGTLHTTMNPKGFLDALAGAANRSPAFRRDTRFKVFGRVSEDVLPMMRSEAVKDMISLSDHVDHCTCLRHMLGAGLLVLLIPDFDGNEMIVTSKIFEYMRSGTPVLCLSRGGLAAEIIRDTGTGVTIDPGDRESLEQFLLRSHARWKKRKKLIDTDIDETAVAQYDRRNTSQKLAELLDRVIDD